jgi:hypothetical protein
MVAEAGALPIGGIIHVVQEHPAEGFGKRSTLGKGLAEGLGDTPADIAGLFIHMPHEAANDILGFFMGFSIELVHNAAKGVGRTVGHIATFGKAGKKRIDERKRGYAFLGTFRGERTFLAPISRTEPGAHENFKGTEAGHD